MTRRLVLPTIVKIECANQHEEDWRWAAIILKKKKKKKKNKKSKIRL